MPMVPRLFQSTPMREGERTLKNVYSDLRKFQSTPMREGEPPATQLVVPQARSEVFPRVSKNQVR